MKTISALARVLILATSLAGPVAYADILFDTTSSVLLTDPTQLGRLSRNGIPQNWGGVESFPGEVNSTTTYHYTTFFINVGLTPFIQIDFDSSLNTFVSAYLGTYDPTSKSTHWIGDAGFSGLLFGTDVPYFDVKVDPNSIIAIVVNTTGARDLGVGDLFHLIVEGYVDAEFTSSVPEPSPLVLAFLPLALLLGREAWKRRPRGEGVPV